MFFSKIKKEIICFCLQISLNGGVIQSTIPQNYIKKEIVFEMLKKIFRKLHRRE